MLQHKKVQNHNSSIHCEKQENTNESNLKSPNLTVSLLYCKRETVAPGNIIQIDITLYFQ